MAENNKSYRVRTKVGREADTFLNVHLEQDYDSIEILSLKISDKDVYKLHNSDYGVVVGRVFANGNFGVPNAKISVFIPADGDETNLERWNIYPYTSTKTINENTDVRYNLLPDESVKDCHVAVGTFPNKTYLLENDSLLEVFDDYYKYTTRTNAAGDYVICGVPTGMQTLHMDLDLSDCGILSQRPRDFVYKGYTIEQFENPNQFKKDTNIDNLAQIFTQDQPVYVHPFWGNEENGEEIGITRADIEIPFKFEPTCVFMGSAISDNASNGVGKKCVPTNQMGAMDELTAGEGTIEMIRKTPGGNVEEFSIRGNQLIDGNGVWCYQIPMNLDYMMTDEYGNMVPTDDPEKGIPTRTRVRFRASLTDMENGSRSYYRAKYLIPNNPGIDDDKVDYNFGTYTDESSYRDLFWNGVYTVKSYIPRFQKSKRWRNERFSGIKACNYYGGNNPMPYNNMRIRLPFMFTVLCVFVKLFVKIVTLVNRFQSVWLKFIGKERIRNTGLHCTFIGDGLCPDMEGWYFAPACGKFQTNTNKKAILFANTLAAAAGTGSGKADDDKTDIPIDATEYTDETSIDYQNTSQDEKESVCLTTNIDYLLNCFEMNLAQEYRVIKFDFYNDWVNGVLYFPRWFRKVKRKKKYKFSLSNGITTYFKDKVQGCMNSETSNVKKSRYYTQQCSLQYSGTPNTPWTGITSDISCNKSTNITSKVITAIRNVMVTTNKKDYRFYPSKCHKKPGMEQSSIFGTKSGLVTEGTTMLGQYVYYLKPCEWQDTNENSKVRTLLFATDIVLLGTLNECDENGIPQAFKYLSNSSYLMPTNLALTTMDDDAYIYSNDSGTVCSSNIVLNANSIYERAQELNEDDVFATAGQFQSLDRRGIINDDATEILNQTQVSGVRRITPDFESTHKAYKDTEYDQVDYKNYDDPIPVTEAAGIMWNYSGPGQDDVDLGILEDADHLLNRTTDTGATRGRNKYNYLYYPGGHFLGLSCVNSDSNIKSCVNLKRICELGASMSQRREELRGYTTAGTPEYRYYVPTGLISNVDIESAVFRSMFATLNHNKLIATDRNESTGYKKYNFRYLRPDGFDGSLASYVHKSGSPYNKVVNNEETPNAITDSSWYFKEIFGESWHEPEDYDPLESKYTERRTVEDTVNDYYMFRFGLDTFNDNEQKKHFLINTGGGHSLPQYENSFYFYFGLKDGATALDEFKKQFFSECQTNNVMRSPSLTIQEEIDTAFTCSAILLINNMLPLYSITLTDDTLGTECKDVIVSADTINLEDVCGTIDMIIGHQYTVTVTDSLDRTLKKTFIYGSSAVKLDVETVNFRVLDTGAGATNDPKKGGYIKISDKITILDKQYSISDSSQDVYFTFNYKINGGDTEYPLTSATTYTDTAEETWVIFFLPSIGTYEIFLNVENTMTASVYTTTVIDNRDINLYVSCDYLSYKADYEVTFDTTGVSAVTQLPTMGLSAVTYNEWTGNTGVFTGSDWENWLMRHTYYRQDQDDTNPYNYYIYTKDGYNLAIFGQPEKGGLTDSSILWSATTANIGDERTCYKGNYEQYEGYSLDESYSFIPTLYWNTDADVHSATTDDRVFRKTFDAMSYSNDGRAGTDASNAEITEYSYDDSISAATLSFTGTLEDEHGTLVVLEDGTMLFGIVSGTNSNQGKIIVHGNNHYANISDDLIGNVLPYATVYPTLCVPSMYKPFYADVTVGLWNLDDLVLDKNTVGETIVDKYKLPVSYKAEGTIHNGLTFFENRFEAGKESPTRRKPYATFMMDAYKSTFWSALTADTANENVPMRELEFGVGNMDSGYCREVRKPVSRNGEVYRDFSAVSYTITEGSPISTVLDSNVLTGRYAKGFDTNVISDFCDVSNIFCDDIKIRVFDSTAGTSGDWCLYTTSPVPENLRIYKAPTQTAGAPHLFNADPEPMSIEDGNAIYCLGIYNENAEYDEKGSKSPVLSGAGGIYTFIKAKKDTTKTIQAVVGEDALYSCGVTLAHKYLLGHTYKNDLGAITAFTTDENLMTIRTPENDTNYSVEHGTGVTGFIQVYEKPEEPNVKNTLTIYKLYAFGAMDIMYPLVQEGGSGGTGDNYLTIALITGSGRSVRKTNETRWRVSTSDSAKLLIIDISTNVDYVVKTDHQTYLFARLVGLDGGILPETAVTGTGYTFQTNVLSFGIDILSNSSGNNRAGEYTIRPAQEGTGLPTLTIYIFQGNDF